MQVVVLRALLLLCVFVSSSMSVVSVLDFFVRGRPLQGSLIAIAMVTLAVAWDPIKFALVGFGSAHHASIVPSMRSAGRLAYGVGFCMSVASILAVGHGAVSAMSPSQEEAEARAEAESQAKHEASKAEEDQLNAGQKRATIEALGAQHAALIASGQVTKAHAVAQQMHALTTGQTGVTASQTRMTVSQTPVKHRSYAITSDQEPISGLAKAGCLLLGLMIEAATCALAIAAGALSGPVMTTGQSSVTAGQKQSTAPDDQTLAVIEEMRTGRLKMTRAQVMVRLGCGASKADKILAQARGMLHDKTASG